MFVKDIVAVIEEKFPVALSEAWDNCGLQIGSLNAPVSKVRIALDPGWAVVLDACRDKVDLLITHHPLFFKPAGRIDMETPIGKIVCAAVASGLSIVSAHTNLDKARGGLNDYLAGCVGLTRIAPFVKDDQRSDGRLLNPNASMPAADRHGLGCAGMFSTPLSLAAAVLLVKNKLQAKWVKAVGNSERIVQTAVVCSGSGGSLVECFLTSDADVFISGEIGYHSARQIEESGKAAIDAGHFATEIPMKALLQDLLVEAVSQAASLVTVDISCVETEPFAMY